MNDDSISSSYILFRVRVDDSGTPSPLPLSLSSSAAQRNEPFQLCADDEHNNIRRKVVVVVVSSSSFLYFVFVLFFCFRRRLFIWFSGISSPFYSFSFRSVSFRFFYLDISPLVYIYSASVEKRKTTALLQYYYTTPALVVKTSRRQSQQLQMKLLKSKE